MSEAEPASLHLSCEAIDCRDLEKLAAFWLVLLGQSIKDAAGRIVVSSALRTVASSSWPTPVGDEFCVLPAGDWEMDDGGRVHCPCGA